MADTDHTNEWLQLLPRNIVGALTVRLTECDRLRQEKTIYPAQGEILNALKYTAPHDVKVVIVGQDPYHGPGQAMGLAFSVRDGVQMPPSLRNIIAEVHNETGAPVPRSGDLTPWARQGVLLMNASLTVEAGLANSMADFGWKPIVEAVVKQTMLDKSPKVYMCWGAFAQNLVADTLKTCPKSALTNKFVIKTTHPSPLSASRGTSTAPAFLGSGQFLTVNRLLEENGVKPIDWKLA